MNKLIPILQIAVGFSVWFLVVEAVWFIVFVTLYQLGLLSYFDSKIIMLTTLVSTVGAFWVARLYFRNYRKQCESMKPNRIIVHSMLLCLPLTMLPFWIKVGWYLYFDHQN